MAFARVKRGRSVRILVMHERRGRAIVRAEIDHEPAAVAVAEGLCRQWKRAEEDREDPAAFHPAVFAICRNASGFRVATAPAAHNPTMRVSPPHVGTRASHDATEPVLVFSEKSRHGASA